LVVLVVNVIALFLLLVPGVNLIAFYAGNGYLLGREYFEMVAMRHLSPEEARRLRKSNLATVFLGGLIIAGLASVPIANLLTPLFATAFMVHVYKSLSRRAGPSGLFTAGCLIRSVQHFSLIQRRSLMVASSS